MTLQRSTLASSSTAPPSQMYQPPPPPYPPPRQWPMQFAWPEPPPMAAPLVMQPSTPLSMTPTSPQLPIPMTWPEPAPVPAPPAMPALTLHALPLPMPLPAAVLPMTPPTPGLPVSPSATGLPVPPSAPALPVPPSAPALHLPPSTPSTTPPLLPTDASLPTFLKPPPVAAKPSIGQTWRLQPYDDLCGQSSQHTADSLRCNNVTGKVEILPNAQRQPSHASENVRRQISYLWAEEGCDEPHTPKCATPICASCIDEPISSGHPPVRQQSFGDGVRRQIDFLFENDW